MIRNLISTIVEVLGLALLVFGVCLFDWRVGVIVGGVVVVLVGLAIDGPIKTGPSR